MMMGFGFPEMLLLALVSGGLNTTDLVALAPPTDYFKSRRFDPSIDRLIDVVIVEPNTPKAQILQLMALRHIADESDAFKKAKNYDTNRLAIEEIADGKRGKDPAGFAQEYAKRVLDKLDGKKSIAGKTPLMRDDALTWFPADTKFALAMDLRQSAEPLGETAKNLLKGIPDGTKNLFYDQLERTGNVRIERFAVGIIEVKNDIKVFVRLTGKGNPAWLGQSVASVIGGNFQSKKIKDADDIPITILQDLNGPTIAIIGNTDIVLVADKNRNGKQDDLLTELLEIRAKKKPHAATGTLKDRLGKIPDKAFAMLVGDVPEELKREIGFLVDPIPNKISAYAERALGGFEVKGEATLANADAATKFVKKAGEARKQAVEELKREMNQPPAFPGMPPIPFKGMIAFMEGIQFQARGDKADGRVMVPSTLVQQMGQMSLWFSQDRFDIMPFPGPPPKIFFDKW